MAALLVCRHFHSLFCGECLVWSTALGLCGGRLSAHVVHRGRAQEEEEDCVRRLCTRREGRVCARREIGCVDFEVSNCF